MLTLPAMISIATSILSLSLGMLSRTDGHSTKVQHGVVYLKTCLGVILCSETNAVTLLKCNFAKQLCGRYNEE